MTGNIVAAMHEAASYIENHARSGADGPVTLERLARHCGLSPWHLQRQFKRVLGVSPRDYDEALRLKRLRRGLKSGAGVADATFEAGFGSSSRVYERASSALGMTPASYARDGRGARIGYTILPCALGQVLIAATDRGICRIELGADRKAMRASLEREFPAAEFSRDDATLAGYAREILARLEGEAPHRDLPLDIRATAFQRRVWRELQAIPHGETRSYGAIAMALGEPRAARAVGGACASNPAAIAIPCHRVLRNDGNIGGYAWGIERKQALIAAERRGAPAAAMADGKKA
jgi:AraC family transcriptional regulator of adaptative response/methylated-DNA-[protein]-cysteine methyltransferase